LSEEIYRRLARHLDDLPGGFPPTESGVELRILERLFTPEEAELALHLQLVPEPAEAIARRAGIEPAEADLRLLEMSRKGLIYRRYRKGEPQYLALQYVIGIWEFHVNDLDHDLIRDMNEYLGTLFEPDLWRRAPQLRTIPISQDIEVEHGILPHENAAELIRSKKRIAVAPCICRREHRMIGEDCGNPEEACLVFNSAADYYVENGIGRFISTGEALEILEVAEENALVLQPGNAVRAANICVCCDCCCQVLKFMKKHPQPGTLAASAFRARVEPELCTACEVCIERCPMDALTLPEGADTVVLDLKRCIGCGNCVTRCPTEAIVLERKAEDEQPEVPATEMRKHLAMARARGKLGAGEIAATALRSGRDRLLSRKSRADTAPEG
jgi:NAD-dependent dihydropyrimidine dehydrogenase PreA subunit